MRLKQIILISALCFSMALASAANIYAAAPATCPITSKENKSDVYTLKLKDKTLSYSKNKESEKNITDVLEAFVDSRNVAYHNSLGISVLDLQADSVRNVNIQLLDSSSTLSRLIFAGFKSDKYYYLDTSGTGQLYKYDEGKIELTALTDTTNGVASKIYNNKTNIFINQSPDEATTPGPLNKVDYKNGTVSLIADQVSNAYVTNKKIFYATYDPAEAAITMGIGEVKVESCNHNGKKQATVATIKDVNTKALKIANNTYFVYEGKDGKFHKYTYKTKKTTSFSQYEAEELLKNAHVLY